MHNLQWQVFPHLLDTLSYAQPAVTQQQSTGYQLTVKDFFQQV